MHSDNAVNYLRFLYSTIFFSVLHAEVGAIKFELSAWHFKATGAL